MKTKQRNSRPAGRSRLPDGAKDSGANDGRDPKGRKITRAQRPLQRSAMLAFHPAPLGLPQNVLDRFSAE